MRKFKIALVSVLLLLLVSSAWSDVILSPRRFLPIDISGCILWLRSDLGITKNENDRVYHWADQSKDNNFIRIPPESTYYLWISSDSDFNNHPTLENDGPAHLFTESGVPIPVSNATVFAVMNITGSDQAILYSSMPPYGHLYLEEVERDVRPPIIGWCDGDSPPTIWLTNSFPVNSSAASIVTLVQNSVSQTVKIYHNGSLFFDENASGANWTMGWDGIFHSNPTYPTKVAELIIYNSVLSNANRLLVEGYLNGRYVIYSVFLIPLKLIPLVMIFNIAILIFAKKNKLGIRLIRRY